MLHFSIIMLSLLIISLSHLYNWLCRKIVNSLDPEVQESVGAMIVAITGIYFVVMYWCFYALIMWGKDLNL